MTKDLTVKSASGQIRTIMGFCCIFFGLAVLGLLTGCQTGSDNALYSVPSASKGSNNNFTNGWKSATAPAVPESYVFQSGDVVKVSFPGSPDLNTTQQIRTDGKISLPLVGEVTAAGLTTAELQKKLKELYAPQISTKQIFVEAQNISFLVYVTGAVLHPGKVVSDHPLTALDAIMEAGGFDYTTANTKRVVVVRQQEKATKHYTLDLRRAMEGNKDYHPFYLKRGDIIYVPQRFQWF